MLNLSLSFLVTAIWREAKSVSALSSIVVYGTVHITCKHGSHKGCQLFASVYI